MKTLTTVALSVCLLLSACAPSKQAFPPTTVQTQATEAPSSLPTSPPTSSPTSLPTPTELVKPTNTPWIIASPPPVLGVGSKMIFGADGMTLFYVPAGSFTMGSSTNEEFEWPAHTVTLDAFWIDRTEVTNKMYSLCVDAGACKKPVVLHSYSHPSYFGNPEFDSYPVIYVDWNMAHTYCEWAGRRLPTEAEWEKAARGEDGRTYPWGNDEPTHDLTNYGGVMKDTTEVGRYPAGASPYGALDLAGNVWEWVADWYSEPYDASWPTVNPSGPESGTARVVKGGAWFYAAKALPSAIHESNSEGPLNSIGFRCAISA